MSKIILTRGLPASGKSTWAIEQTRLGFGSVVRLNRDDLRESLFQQEGVLNREQEGIITRMHHEAARLAISQGRDVIVDGMNMEHRYNKEWAQFGVPVLFQDFHTPLSEVFANDSARGAAGGREVGAKVIARLAKRYKVEDDGILPPVKLVEVPTFYPAAPWSNFKSNAYIVDIDGTLANHKGVRNVYDEEKVDQDRVHGDVARVVNKLEEEGFIILVSGRHESAREKTEEWLEANGIRYDELYMRRGSDNRKDDVVKHDIYNYFIAPTWNVLGVFDDRAQVLRMWRKIGLTTFAVGDTDNNNF